MAWRNGIFNSHTGLQHDCVLMLDHSIDGIMRDKKKNSQLQVDISVIRLRNN